MFVGALYGDFEPDPRVVRGVVCLGLRFLGACTPAYQFPFLGNVRVGGSLWYHLRQGLNAHRVFAEEVTVCRERHTV